MQTHVWGQAGGCLRTDWRRQRVGVGGKYLGMMDKFVLLTMQVGSECIHTSRCIQLHALQFIVNHTSIEMLRKKVTQCGRWGRMFNQEG